MPTLENSATIFLGAKWKLNTWGHVSVGEVTSFVLSQQTLEGGARQV